MSLADGTSLGIQEGETVAIVSPHGMIQRRMVLNERLGPGFLYVPRAVHDNDATSLVPFGIPGEAGVPGANVVRVNIERGPGV